MFKNLKSLFIVENEGETPSSPSPSPRTTGPTSKNTPRSTGSAPPAAGTTTNRSAGSGKVTEKFSQILFGAMEKNNIDGFDYLEYRQSLQSLKKMNMDESTRYKSAYAMAQTMGASPDYLVKTAQHYLDVLKKEEDKFETALKNQRSRQEGEKDQLGKLEQDVSQASQKVESTKNDFIASYQAIVGQISQDVENMKQYLK